MYGRDSYGLRYNTKEPKNSDERDSYRKRFRLSCPARVMGLYAVRASVSLSSLIICFRIMNFCGLPVAVIGNSATNLM
jgi:hypothetical protein